MGSFDEERAAACAEVRAIRETAASVAHGLNTLLGAVAGLATQLVETADPAGHLDELRLIQQATSDSLGLTRRLLQLSRGEPALDPGHLDLVDMGRVLADAVELMKAGWQERARLGVAIEHTVEVDRPLLVRGVASELREIVGNLIANAVDAMPGGGRLQVRGTRLDRWAVVVCQDSGVGMPPEVARQVFEPFFTTKGERGTGLGLAIVRSVVARHGGDASVSSEVGVGTTVTLRLPAADVLPAAGLAPAGRALAVATAGSLVAAPNGTRGPNGTNGKHGAHDHARAWVKPAMRLRATGRVAAGEQLAATLAPLSILVVEDDPVFRGVFARRLGLDARRVDAVADAGSALAALEMGAWDMLCMDDGLPDMTGRQLAAEIRRRGLPCATILVTGAATGPDDPDLAGPGVDAVLPKPCADEELARALRTALARQVERSRARA